MRTTERTAQHTARPAAAQTDGERENIPRISVIMPVYNVEDYLAWSVKSVLDQSYPSFELICVDDGSIDGSGALLDALAATDDRIVAVHQPNSGPSKARNTGMDRAMGDVVTFLDSDDFMRLDALQTIAAAYTAAPFDALVYGADAYPPSEGSAWLTEVLSPHDAEYDAFHPDILFKERSHPFTWRTAFRRQFLQTNSIRYDENTDFAEDQIFLFQAYPLSKKTVFIADKLIGYRVKRKNSLMALRFDDLSMRSDEHIDALEKILSHWSSSGYLARWPHEMFVWSMDFMLGSLIHSANAGAFDDAAGKLSILWQRYFDQGFLTEQTHAKITGPIVRAVMDPNQRISSRQLMLALFTLRRHTFGLRYALRQAAEQLRARLQSKRTHAAYDEWTQADAQARRAAKDILLGNSNRS
ncbi:glycosyltransferase family 2 protein [Adlercreutzia murintestinalis]|uniref:glycosyltransferase family 2 protein n=1 Tax=Adlercreutzia murintestinalis TaxID=2941325 RepID=UPI00204142A1|nr:glycosyltransferase family 2 protein [Adlercreutzia murintestinalis]